MTNPGARLAARFAARRGWPSPPAWLAARLAAILDETRHAHPGVSLPDDEFIDALADRLPAGDDPEAALASLCAADLWLALACARGDAVALRRFDETILRAVIGQVARGSDGDELCQEVRDRLFVGPPRRIETYAGRGALAGWVRIVARRSLLNRDRGARARRSSELLADPRAAVDPDVALLRARYREPVDAALRVAVKRLGAEERQLLRLHYLEGVSLQQIGRMHGVDRSTASRRVSAARAALLAETKAALSVALELTPQSLESVLRAVRSQLDASLGELLRTV